MSTKLEYNWPCKLPSSVTSPSVRLRSIVPVFPEFNSKKQFYPLLPNLAGMADVFLCPMAVHRHVV
jgi:hypothetical protein